LNPAGFARILTGTQEAAMSIPLYDVTIPVFQRGLGSLGALLNKGRAFAAAEGMDQGELLGARLAPDMLPLTGQVQRASDTAKFAAVRVGGVPNEAFADEERSFEDLADRIARTRAFLADVPRSAFEHREAATISATIGRTAVSLTGRDYVLGFALPNFFFHVTTAYDILRHRGVPIGKMDYIGPLS
jgi:hypothetical protein